jgi:ELWxxDGT repeat protein
MPFTLDAANLTAVGNKLFFTAADPQHGTELWKSNGTVVGTRILKDIDPGLNSSELWAVGGTLVSPTFLKAVTPGRIPIPLLETPEPLGQSQAHNAPHSTVMA